MISPISDAKPSLKGSPQNGLVVLFGEVLADVFPDRSVLGGAPFNVARHLQAFGCEPMLLSRVGDDALGRDVLATLLHSTKASRFLDVNLRAPWYDERTLAFSLEMADIVKLNDQELQELADMFGLASGDPHSQALALMHHFDQAQVVVTCGAKGAWQMGRDAHVVESGAGHVHKAVIDTVGAGDGFSAVYLLGTLRHWPTALTLERANAFAASICGIRGAIPDAMTFYQPFSQAWAL